MATLVHTIIMVMPVGRHNGVVTVKIYTDQLLTNAKCEGYWIVGSNKVLLSSRLYQQFKELRGNRAHQKAFFDQLVKVSPKELPLNIKIS